MFLEAPTVSATPIIDSSMLANVQPQVQATVQVVLPVMIGVAVIIGGVYLVKKLVKSSVK